MTSGAHVVVALLAFEEAMHGKPGTLADRVLAMSAALQAAQDAQPGPRVPVFDPSPAPRAPCAWLVKPGGTLEPIA